MFTAFHGHQLQMFAPNQLMIYKDDDPDAIRAQVDTGAHASCTDQKHILHGY